MDAATIPLAPTAAVTAPRADPSANGPRQLKPLWLLVLWKPSVPARRLDPGLVQKVAVSPLPPLVLAALMASWTETQTRRQSAILQKLSSVASPQTASPTALAVEAEVEMNPPMAIVRVVGPVPSLEEVEASLAVAMELVMA